MRITLDQGLYELCSKRTGKKINREEEFQKYREEELSNTIKYAYEHSRFYKKMMDDHQIDPSSIKKIEDLQKLPFTFPDDLRGKNYEFLCTSQGKVERPVTFFSSGTTGIKKRIFFSKNDVKHIMEYISRAMNVIADNDDTRALSLIANSQGRGASSLYCQSLALVGMQGYPMEIEADSKEIVRKSKEHKCNVWFGDVITINRVAKEMSPWMDMKSLGLKLLFVTMGNVSESMKKYLEDVYGCEVLTHYGLTEAGWGFAIDCRGSVGYQYNELDVIVEIVDPETGKRLEKGEEGEITITTIGRESMPLIRYRTGDISAFLKGTASKNRKELKHIIRRLEGCYQTRNGQLLYPAILEEILFKDESVIDYRPYVKNDGLKIQIESMDCSERKKEKIRENLSQDEVIASMEIPVEVELLPAGSLRKYCYEKKTIITS